MHTIYTKSGCRYCTVALKWITDSKIPFQEFSLDNDEDRALFKAAYPYVKSVPAIFNGDGDLTMQWQSATRV